MTHPPEVVDIVARALQGTGTMVPWDALHPSRHEYWIARATTILDRIAPMMVTDDIARLRDRAGEECLRRSHASDDAPERVNDDRPHMKTPAP